LSAAIQIQLDFRSGLPIYLQITEQIRTLVADGRLKPGDQLPTVRQMATDLRVNFNTVARAYRLLDEAGLISTQQGRGTYIWQMPDEATSSQLRHESLEALAHRFAKDSARLGFALEDAQDAIARHWQDTLTDTTEREEENED